MRNLDFEIVNSVIIYKQNKLWDKMYYNVSCKVWGNCWDGIKNGIRAQLTNEVKKNIIL